MGILNPTTHTSFYRRLATLVVFIGALLLVGLSIRGPQGASAPAAADTPAKTLGLWTTQQNPSVAANIAPSNEAQAKTICHGDTFPKAPNEWERVVQDPAVGDSFGISGVALWGKDSGGDVMFTHPFSWDREFWIAPDQQYQSLLAEGNMAGKFGGSEYQDAYDRAVAHGLTPLGVLGVEIDQGLLPQAYTALEDTDRADRVAVFGSWIVDCGHEPFHTEIHPPLLVARGRGDGESMDTTVVGRPYWVQQILNPGGQPLKDHFLNEVDKVGRTCGWFFVFIPCSFRVEAHATFADKPFAGVHSMDYFIAPENSRRDVFDELVVNYHLVERSGVTASVTKVGDVVKVHIEMDASAYNAPPLPPKHDWNVSEDEIKQDKAAADGLQDFDNLVVAAKTACFSGSFDACTRAGILGQDVLADKYDPLSPLFARDHGGESGQTIEADANNQPFPLQGWINVRWNRNASSHLRFCEFKATDPSSCTPTCNQNPYLGCTLDAVPVCGTQRIVATVTGPLDGPIPGALVQFRVSGANNGNLFSPSGVTDSGGRVSVDVYSAREAANVIKASYYDPTNSGRLTFSDAQIVVPYGPQNDCPEVDGGAFDFNRDGQVDVSDASVIMSYLARARAPCIFVRCLPVGAFRIGDNVNGGLIGDVHCDARIDSIDVLSVLRIVAGLSAPAATTDCAPPASTPMPTPVGSVTPNPTVTPTPTVTLTPTPTPKPTAIATTPVATTTTSPPGDRMLAGDVLLPGESITSANGCFTLVYQTDGNLVLYRTSNHAALWASNTVGTAGSTTMQGDGNLVVKNAQSAVVWSSGNPLNAGAYLVMQNDANVVIYPPSGPATWSTGTAGQPCAPPTTADLQLLNPDVSFAGLATCGLTPCALTDVPFTVKVSATLHNNGPATPVNADATAVLAILGGACTKSPDSLQTEQGITLSHALDVPVTLEWSVTCSSTGSHNFRGDIGVLLDQPGVSDPSTPNNNGEHISSLDVETGAP